MVEVVAEEIDDSNSKIYARTKNIIREYQIWSETLVILKWINLTINDGEFVAIMWPSWSGKSTLMNTIGLLDKPTSGKYFIDWFDTSKLTENDEAEFRGKKIWFIFQWYNLVPRLSALEQVMLPLEYQWFSREECEKWAKKALERVGLKEKWGIYQLNYHDDNNKG